MTGVTTADPQLSVDAFVTAMNHFASGVAVVTSQDDERAVGATVAAIAPISSDPATLMVSMSRTSSTAAAVIARGSFAVNVLDEDAASLAGVFATRRSDKFVGLPTEPDPLGNPLLPHRVASLTCRVVESLGSGSHWEIRGRVVDVQVVGGHPLAYYRGSFAHLQTDADRSVLDDVRAHVLAVRSSSSHHLDPDALASAFAVSRGAVLRALSRLGGESLVVRRDGAYHVAAVSDEVVDAAYAAKLVLEVGVATQVVGRLTQDDLRDLRDHAQRVAAAEGGGVDALVEALDAFGEHFIGLAGSAPLVRAYRSLGLPGIDRRTISDVMVRQIPAGGGLAAVVDGLERGDLDAVLEALRAEQRTPAFVRRHSRGR